MTQEGPGIRHVNHVVYVVRDLQRAVAFYRDLLGIRQIPKMVDADNIVWLQVPSGVMLHLIEAEEQSPPAQHVAFEVEDFDRARRFVQGKGLPILLEGVRKDGQRFLFIQDPDGNRVELCTPSGF